MSKLGKWTRRGLLITGGLLVGGGLAIGIAISPGQRQRKVAPLIAQEGEHLLQVWVKIATNNLVTVIVPHAEMGQGVLTSLPMMLADEMEADWSQIRVETAPALSEFANGDLAEGFILGVRDIPKLLVGAVRGAFLETAKGMHLQITGGSSSVRATGYYGMRVAGAAARDMLLQAAAQRFGVSQGDLTIRAGLVTHAASGQRATFGELAELAATMDAPIKPPLKSPEEFRIIGTDVARTDLAGKVDGTAFFGIDAHPEGLQYAAVQASPVFGGRLTAVDDSKLANLPGITQLVKLDDAVAVVADSYWRAKKGLDALVVEFDGGAAAQVSSGTVHEQFSKSLDELAERGGGEVDRDEGDLTAAFAGTPRIIEAEYRVPWLAHACMEPLNATAWLHDGKLELWTGNQNPLGFRKAVSKVVGLEPEQVIVHPALLGGGFGRRAQPDYAEQAARIAMQVSGPVKVIWSREEDIRQDRYRPASISRFKGALDSDGRPVAWTNDYILKDEPEEAPLIPYGIASQRIRSQESPTHIPRGPWRSVAHSQHGFFTESFIDELAHAAGKDPYEFRRDLLAEQPRHLAVLEAAAKGADWGAPLPNGWGRGISVQYSFGSYVAQVVEAEVTSAGRIKVQLVFCAADCGIAVHPDGLKAQMESGIIYGLTAALFGEISIDKGQVVQSNFHDYRMVRMDDAPKIETIIVNSGEAMGGAGEPGTPGIAPALANAIYAATGTRIRELPMSKYDLKFRIQEPA